MLACLWRPLTSYLLCLLAISPYLKVSSFQCIHHCLTFVDGRNSLLWARQEVTSCHYMYGCKETKSIEESPFAVWQEKIDEIQKCLVWRFTIFVCDLLNQDFTVACRYVECSKCSQAIPAVRMSLHLKSRECKHGKHHRRPRCPLCRHVVQPGDAGWREHLLKPPGCSKNIRTITLL
jgi:hypothetical protein